jgi:hypothetical protein
MDFASIEASTPTLPLMVKPEEWLHWFEVQVNKKDYSHIDFVLIRITQSRIENIPVMSIVLRIKLIETIPVTSFTLWIE